jgi:folylpolyglutamate synthase/dihydropteroate synthase
MTLVTASMVDKDVDGMIAALSWTGTLADATIVCTSVGVARAMDAAQLAHRWRTRIATARVVAEPDPIAAIDRAIGQSAAANGPVVVAGSLYLVGAARGHLVVDPDLRDPDPTDDA